MMETYPEQTGRKRPVTESNNRQQQEAAGSGGKQLEAEQGNLSQYTEQQERAAKAKVDFAFTDSILGLGLAWSISLNKAFSV